MQQLQEFILQNQWVIYALIAWTIPWKGIALWKSAKKGQKIWFVILLLFNTLGILDIIYIVFICKEKKEEMKDVPMIPRNGGRVI